MVHGFMGFFNYTAMKADFSMYLNYLKNVCGNKGERISKCGVSLDGIFCLMCLFLRSDLMDDYIHHDTGDGMCVETLGSVWYLMQPNLLLQYQKNMKKIGIPLSKRDEYEMDLFKNPRYHPFNRIMALRKLCFSSNFAVSWREHFIPLI